MYDPKSAEASEFINHEEIVATLAFAAANKSNRERIEQVIDKAAEGKGLNHREASLLLECDQPDLNERMYDLAKKLKQKLYGNRIVMLPRSICPITVSMAACIVPIIIRTRPSTVKNCRRKTSGDSFLRWMSCSYDDKEQYTHYYFV